MLIRNRGTHTGDLPLLVIRRPAAQLQRHDDARPVPGQALRPAAEEQVQQPRGHDDAGGDGPGQLPDLRRELLQARRQGQVPLHLRPDAHERPLRQGLRPAAGRRGRRRRLPGRVLRRLRGVHGEDGRRAGAHRRPGRGPEALRVCELKMRV